MTDALPSFPDLEPIELCHLPEIRSMTARFPSYSDFNAVSLWTWNASGPYRVGQLHGNLVVEFCDYLTGETFLSFIGDTEVAKTTLTLLEAAKSAPGLSDELRLVPEHTVEQLRGDPRFILEPQYDERDYLYSPDHIVGLKGTTYREIRKRLLRFDRASEAAGGVDIVAIAARELASLHSEFQIVMDRWFAGTTEGVQYAASERKAVDRLCETAIPLSGIAALQLHVALRDNELLGFSVSEYVNSTTLAAHFCKSDGRIPDLSTRFFIEKMRVADDRGIETVNMEQDLGILGLRTYKSRLRPSAFLHKYLVSLAP